MTFSLWVSGVSRLPEVLGVFRISFLLLYIVFLFVVYVGYTRGVARVFAIEISIHVSSFIL